MAQRFEGRNIEEALTSAADTLGVERYRLLYHVVLEKRGFLGGMKRVVVEAEVNESASEQPPAQQQQPTAPAATSPSARARRERTSRPTAGDGSRGGQREPREPRGARGRGRG